MCCPACLGCAPPPPPAALSLPPIPPPKQLSFFFCNSFSSLLLLSRGLVFSPCAPPEQTSLCSFFFFLTIGPRLQGCHTHKGPASLVRGCKKKKAEGGYCWCTESLCITSAKTWTQTKECRHQKNTHTFSATSNPATIKGWGPGKLGQRGYFYGCALFGGCRVPRLPYRDALFLMLNSFKRVFPSFFFFVSFCTYEWGTFLWEKWKWFFSMGFQRSMRKPLLWLGSAVLCYEHQGACAWAICWL